MKEDTTIKSIYEELIDQVKEIDTDDLNDDIDQSPQTDIVEGQKVYFWIRLYTKEEVDNVKEGDEFKITYKGDESLEVQFIAYGKKNITRDVLDDIINYDPEDDRKCLCLMVDEDRIKNQSSDIPFIRTLFKTSPFYEHQVYKKSDLKFYNKRTGEYYTYIDVDF